METAGDHPRRRIDLGNWRLRLSVVGLAGLALAGCSSPTTVEAEPEPRLEPGLAVETFDFAWERINETHFDPEFNGVDWEAVQVELRPEAESAETQRELRRVLNDMIGRFGQSHFAILPSEAVDALAPEPAEPSDAASTSEGIDSAEDQVGNAHRNEPPDNAASPSDSTARNGSEADGRFANPGVQLRLIEERVVVFRVRPTSPAESAGVETGWIVTSIGRLQVDDLLERMPHDIDPRIRRLQIQGSLDARLGGTPGSTAEVGFLTTDDDALTLELTRETEPGVPVKFGNLPPFMAALERERIDSDGVDVGVIRFNIWMGPINRPFHEAVDDFREAEGIIIDLRGNPGGIGAMAMGLAGHFFDDRVTLGTFTTRETELKFIAFPRRITAEGQRTRPYDGPVAILVDAGTGSTSEIFAGGMQSTGRARVFGETTMGAALPALMSRLPNGDVLLHAFADYVDANDVHLEGRGVVPDEPIALTRADLLEGRDAVMEAAVAWIASQAHPPDSGPGD